MKCPNCNEEMSRHIINGPMSIVIDFKARGSQTYATPDACVCLNCGKVELVLGQEKLEYIKSRLR